MSQKKNYYFGIDLGTTNSLISWGVIDPRVHQFNTKTVDINMIITGGGMAKKELLPSYVYFKEKQEPIVGEYAKSMIARQAERVVKSIKSHIGNSVKFFYDGKNYAPSEISSLILRHLVKSAEALFNFIPEDIVITVPACFDSDMRNATIEAARLAGIKTTEDDGSPRNILLDEPRAALYDFINRQNKGEIPDSLIDFREPKTVLVFDLGGGTLDVSLHRVYLSDDTKNIEIDDYAISRYTKIGGDDFDQLLANRFLEEFCKSKKIFLEKLNNFEQRLLKANFLEFAEQAKVELSNTIENKKVIGGLADFSSVKHEIIKGNVHDNKLFEYTLSYPEYEEIISPLMGNNLSLSSLENFDDIDFEEANNIVYPILDVLQKGKDKVGTPPHIDAILLNGGMTKLYSIQKRLEILFGFKPICAGDPDKAVARGASVYHYNLHRGIKPTKILNDTIGIEVTGGFVKHLVQAGTVLPCEPKIFTEFVVQNEGATFLDLPFYLGRRKDINPPNRQIASRRVKFGKALKEGEAINIKVMLDKRGIMTLEGWSEYDPEHKFTVTVLSDEQTNEKPQLGIKSLEVEGFNKKKKQNYVSSGENLDIENTLKDLDKYFKRYSNTYDPWYKKDFMEKIKYLEGTIIKSQNGKDFIKPLLKLIDSVNNDGKGRILILLGNLTERYSEEYSQEVCQKAMQMTAPNNIEENAQSIINTIGRYAVEAIGKTGLPIAESHLISLLHKNNTRPIRSAIIHSIGKIGNSNNSINHLKQFINLDNTDRIATYWAMGRIGSREKEDPVSIKALHEVIKLLSRKLIEETHNDAKRNCIYALGEICDSRYPEKGIVEKQIADSIVKILEKKFLFNKGKRDKFSILPDANENKTLINYAQISINMIKGSKLSEEQERQLMAIRTILS